MTGGIAILVALLPVLLPPLAIAGIWGKEEGQIRYKEILGTVLALVVLLAGSYTFARTLYSLEMLHSLKFEDVQSVKVDGVTILDSEKREAIIVAMNRSVFFVSYHGGWSRKIPLEITKKAGKVYRFSVAEYASKGGTVVFTPYRAYSQSLTAALSNLDVREN